MFPFQVETSVSDSLHTRPTLLLRMRDAADQQAWSEFVEIYGPLIRHFARRRGLQDADAADLSQDVLHTVASHIGRMDYDPHRGRFRGWLFTITRNKLSDYLSRRQRQQQATGDTDFGQLLQQIPDEQSDEQVWNEHHQWHLFLWAANQVRDEFRDKTWQAFWSAAIDDQPAATIAQDLSMSVGAVHIAKSRVLARIRQMIGAIEESDASVPSDVGD